MGVWDDRKVTPGITESSRPRARISLRLNNLEKKILNNSHSIGVEPIAVKIMQQIHGPRGRERLGKIFSEFNK